MAIRDWHWGQLLVFWVASALVWLVIGGTLDARGLFGEPSEWETVALIVMLLALFPGIPLAVTWRWFGGRRRGP